MVTFDRALWLELQGQQDAWVMFDVFRGKRTLRVHLSKPRLVLFEWADRRVDERFPAPTSRPGDTLRTGLLILEAYFENPDGKPPANCAGGNALHTSVWTLDDLLVFNEFFRYWQQPWQDDQLGQVHCAKVYGDGGPTPTTYCGFMSKAPSGLVGTVRDSCKTGGGTTAGAPAYFERWADLLKLPVEVRLGAEETKYYSLFPDPDAACSGKKAGQATCQPSERRLPSGGDGRWLMYADNRAFVWTCAILTPESAARLREASLPGALEISGHWVKLVNVDQADPTPSLTVRSTHFERDWVAERTYRRWAHFGTLYGFAYHAGAMLGERCVEPPTWKHFGSMYFDQTLLLLYLRVTTFRFSQALAASTADARQRQAGRSGNGFDDRLIEEFCCLRQQFAQFTNLYQFPLLSNQQQAVEMYSLQRKIMDVGALFDEVKAEIESTHEFLEMEAQRAQATASLRLNVVATLGLGLGLAFAALGMGVLVVENNFLSRELQWALLVSFLPVGVSLMLWASSWRWLAKLMASSDRPRE